MLTQYFYPENGAAQVRLLEVAKAIRDHGHEIEVVTAFPNYPSGVIPAAYKGKFFMKDSHEGIAHLPDLDLPSSKGKVLEEIT